MPDNTIPSTLSDAERLVLIKQERAKMEAVRRQSTYNPYNKPYTSWYTEAARIQKELEQLQQNSQKK